MKRIIKLKESELKGIIEDSVHNIIERIPNVGRNVLNEMARLNKKDGSQSPFPSNKYKLWVQGENSPHKPPHMHVYYPQDGWEIKVFIENGELWQIVSYGNRGRRDTFEDVIKMVKEWFTLPTSMPGRVGTNKDAAENEWDACNDD
jgi:hypothetical protein